MKIPLAMPDLSGNEERLLLDAFRSSWISSRGKYVDDFEEEFAALIHTKYAASVVNGTAALHLALEALGVGHDDEVIVPALTYIAAAGAVKFCGAEPVFVDVDPSTWCIDPGRIEDAISPKTKAIIAVHLYGHPCDMDAINAIAAVHGLKVIEDAAEAHFAQYKGRMIGSLGDVAAFSFFGNKILTSGEGGALTYDAPDLDRRIRILRSQGMDPQRQYYHPIIGYNYRMTNLACALLCGQIERRNELLAKRRAIFVTYKQLLSTIQGVELQPVANWAEPAPWLFCITVNESEFGMSRDALASRLAELDIETRPFFVPLHLMPPFENGDRNSPGAFPVAEFLGRSGLNLPTYAAMTPEMVAYVCTAIEDIQRSLPSAARPSFHFST